MSHVEINEWLIKNSAFISEGQIKRISTGGDLHEYIDLEDGLESLIDFDVEKIGMRMKGTKITVWALIF